MEKAKLLIVDDEIEIISALKRVIKRHNLWLEVFIANTPQKAIEILKSNEIDILITDQRMPVTSGLELIDEFKKHHNDVQCVLMSGFNDFDVVISAINEEHIVGFITKPWNETKVIEIIERALILREERYIINVFKGLSLANKEDWIKAFELIKQEFINRDEIQITALTKLIKAKDPELYEHSVRISELAVKIGTVYNLSDEKIHDLKMAAIIHDLGKIAIRDSIHYKAGKLDEMEFFEMKRHPEIGAEILEALGIDVQIVKIVMQHHERVDGNGYPNKLKANEILLEAKILSVADAYDAMTSDRVYRKGLTKEAALEIIKGNVGILYDKEVYDILNRIV